MSEKYNRNKYNKHIEDRERDKRKDHHRKDKRTQKEAERLAPEFEYDFLRNKPR